MGCSDATDLVQNKQRSVRVHIVVLFPGLCVYVKCCPENMHVQALLAGEHAAEGAHQSKENSCSAPAQFPRNSVK